MYAVRAVLAVGSMLLFRELYSSSITLSVLFGESTSQLTTLVLTNTEDSYLGIFLMVMNHEYLKTSEA